MEVQGLDLFGGHPLRDWLAAKLVDAAVGKGADKGKAQAVVAKLVAEKSILDWLSTVDWLKLVELVLKLIALLG